MPTTMVDLVKSDWRSSKPDNVISLHLHGAAGEFWVGLQLGFLQTNLYTGWEGPQVTQSASQQSQLSKLQVMLRTQWNMQLSIIDNRYCWDWEGWGCLEWYLELRIHLEV